MCPQATHSLLKDIRYPNYPMVCVQDITLIADSMASPLKHDVITHQMTKK